jgi:5-oxopent-3-ene-1,2,5-tricarboxylate decarboxylase/2-hydroxyhepta-2,4-diene-1,7-dioate isomerase
MRKARFFASGLYHEGVYLPEEGILIDEAGKAHSPEAVSFLPPVEPTKVLGLALNYEDHADELGVETPSEPVLFLKPPNTWIGHRAPVIYPHGVRYLHYEVELAVVIGRRCRRVRAERAYEVIGGYTIANDLTVRDFVGNLYRPPVRAKGWDTFCPMGPYLVMGEVEDENNLELRTYVNGQLRQRGSTRHLLWKVPEIVEFVSHFMTLEEGDVILTGTPRGVSHVFPGDLMRLEIDGLGALENPVVAEEA